MVVFYTSNSFSFPKYKLFKMFVQCNLIIFTISPTPPSLPFSQTIQPPLPPLLLHLNQAHFVLCINLGYGSLPLESSQPTRVPPFKKISLSLGRVNSSLSMGGTLCTPPFLKLVFFVWIQLEQVLYVLSENS